MADARPIDQNAEQLLGQMLFAIGQGAGGVHVHRSAVARLRERYESATYDLVRQDGWETRWNADAIYTLRYFEAIGRLAAQHAARDGSPAITAQTLDDACTTVESRYRWERDHPEGPSQDTFARGMICPWA